MDPWTIALTALIAAVLFAGGFVLGRIERDDEMSRRRIYDEPDHARAVERFRGAPLMVTAELEKRRRARELHELAAWRSMRKRSGAE